MTESVTTALTAVLHGLIAAEGAITLERYMEIVLHHPDHGYYRHGNPLGAEGDFSTAPEMSQMFGEMIGVWCLDAWRRLGQPDSFVLLELGPGLGTLLRNALDFIRSFPAFQQAMRLHLLESSATLRAVQEEKLGGYRPIHSEKLEDLPRLPTIVVANEFFDTFPLRQFVRVFRGWRERLVTLKNGRLEFTQGRRADLPGGMPLHFPARNLKRGWMHETSPCTHRFMDQLCRHIAAGGGAGLVVDYGYDHETIIPPKTGTLDALSRHRFVDIFAAPGKVDVTAGVDFSLLAATARQRGARVKPLVSQGGFLSAMGIFARAENLKRDTQKDLHQAIDRDLRHLTSPECMGRDYSALEIFFPGATSAS